MDQNVKLSLIKKNLPERFILKHSVRKYIFIILFLSIIASHFTMSIFRGSSKEIKKELKLDEATYGIFGTLYNLGKVLSTIILLCSMNQQNRRRMISSALFSASMLLLLFKFTTNKYILMPSFFFTSFCIMTINVYVPIWIDQFSINKYKTIYLTLVQFGKSLGTVLGFIINYKMKGNTFKEQFMCESLLLLFFSLNLLCIPNVYFSKNILIVKEVNENEQFNFTDPEDNNQERNGSIVSLFKIRYSNESTFDDSFCNKMCKSLFNKIYFTSIISATILVVTESALNFWIIDYIPNVLKENDEQKRLVYHLLISISGPAGAIITNALVTLCVGNYNEKYTPLFMFIIYIIATLSGNYLSYINEPSHFIYLSIIYFMSCFSCLPILQGICLGYSRISLKAMSLTLFNLIVEIFGEVPSTFFYGLIYEKYKNIDKTYSLRLLMYSLFVGLFFSFLTLIFTCIRKNKEREIFVNKEFSGVEMKETKPEIEDKKSIHSTVKLDSVSESGGNDSHRRENSFSDK